MWIYNGSFLKHTAGFWYQNTDWFHEITAKYFLNYHPKLPINPSQISNWSFKNMSKCFCFCFHFFWRQNTQREPEEQSWCETKPLENTQMENRLTVVSLFWQSWAEPSCTCWENPWNIAQNIRLHFLIIQCQFFLSLWSRIPKFWIVHPLTGDKQELRGEKN